MHKMGVEAAFVVVLMFSATVKTESAFWRDKVTLTCPSDGIWYDSETKVQSPTTATTFEFVYQHKAQYYCEYKKTESDDTFTKRMYYFYVKGKACENCFEVDGFLFMLVIIVDLIGTSVLMIIVYSCTKKKSPDQRSQSRSKSGGRAPPVPAADYEQLNPNSESTETYSAVVIRSR
ncbi:T-cell surface glycoprotein CD3 epsilon chain-like [Nematolebias whitei]|uniref:T-cell surface glycoprotein CD3 epsilon chain-like n=1 Tax=Nematolebias whitei TaxID=451745 RepID=UPI0018982A48|nr:T-cell surface glycoprotein CD3 epsilon chain-like [Nematolebias whitei]